MTQTNYKYRVGELRPSQILFDYGVGAVADLPNLSVMVMGLEDWDNTRGIELGEERLLAAVRRELGLQVKQLLSPPFPSESIASSSPLDDLSKIGIPVAPNPLWLLLGASNSWFSIALSALSIPTASGHLEQLVEQYWTALGKATSLETLQVLLSAMYSIGQLQDLAKYSLDDIWSIIDRKQTGTEAISYQDLKTPEWEVFSAANPANNTKEFQLRTVDLPPGYSPYFSQVVLIERLREVRALIGFTRIQSPGDFADVGEVPVEYRDFSSVGTDAPVYVRSSVLRLRTDSRGSGFALGGLSRLFVQPGNILRTR